MNVNISEDTKFFRRTTAVFPPLFHDNLRLYGFVRADSISLSLTLSIPSPVSPYKHLAQDISLNYQGVSLFATVTISGISGETYLILSESSQGLFTEL